MARKRKDADGSSGGSSSDGSDGHEGAAGEQQQQQLRGSGKARAPNRHRFKNLAERIDDVSRV
jgi:hypothetical protein